MKRNRLRSIALGAIVCSAFMSVTPRAASAQLMTIVTDHFRIHYSSNTVGTARRVAETAEEVFAPLATAYNYYDDFSPIHIIVIDNSDRLGNGSANYYSNTITIWATNLDSDLRGSHDWVRNVLTHELAHIITLNKARQKWPVQFALLSVTRFTSNPDVRFEIPLYHLTAPAWWSEGIAQYATHQFGYETWDTHRDMLLRMAVLEDDLHSYTEMGGLQNRGGGYYGELVYNQGYGLLLYIDETYGREQVEALTHHTGRLSFDAAVDKVLGISAGQLYDDWVQHLEKRYGERATRIAPSLFEGDELADLNQGFIEYYPSFSPDGKKIAYVTSEDRDFPIPKLVIHDFETGETKRLDGFTDTRVSWSPDSREIAYVRNKSGFNDLYIYDLEADEETRISARLRAKDPDFSPDGERLVFIHNEDGTNNLGLIDRGGTNLAYLTNHNDGTQYSAPRWSPDGEWLLFSIFQGEDRDIAMMRAASPPLPKELGIRDRTLDDIPDSLRVFPDSLAFPHADTSGFRAVLASKADERDPFWLPDGSGFVFSSDRTGIFNIYEYRLATGEVEQMTNVLGGAFTPTADSTGRIAYSGYHASDYSLYEFHRGDYAQEAQFETISERDYQSVLDLPSISDEYDTQRYGGRQILGVVPTLGIGTTAFGNAFGLNQAVAGVQISKGEMMGGQRLTASAQVGKNFTESTDLNTDLSVFYRQSLRPVVGNNRSFNPSFSISFRRREIDNLITSRQTTSDSTAMGNLVAVVDSSDLIIIPDADRYTTQTLRRGDLLKRVFATVNVGIGLPMTRRQRVSLRYGHRDYDESWELQSVTSRVQAQVLQDGLDISDDVPEELTDQLVTFVDPISPQNLYSGLDYFSSHEFAIGYVFQDWQRRADGPMNPAGRALSMSFRYWLPTVADSLSQRTPADGVPGNQFAPVQRRLRINEYLGSYVERIGLPFSHTLSLQAFGGYRNLRLKPSVVPDGGTFEGRFYWPLRYYIGGLNFLSGYPYFTNSGSKLLYGRVGYRVPLIRRLNRRLFNLTFSKLYGELFAEAGAVGNFEGLDAGDFDTDDFLTDVGGELRMQVFSFYRISMTAFFQAAHPLNRDRVRSTTGLSIDSWRYYFGIRL